jgi:hypothetical protein
MLALTPTLTLTPKPPALGSTGAGAFVSTRFIPTPDHPHPNRHSEDTRPSALGEGLGDRHGNVESTRPERRGVRCWEVNFPKFPNIPGDRIWPGADSPAGLVPCGGAAVRGQHIDLSELPVNQDNHG